MIHNYIKYIKLSTLLFLLVSCLFVLPKNVSASTCEDGRGVTARVSGRIWDTVTYGYPKTSIGVAGVTVRITRGDDVIDPADKTGSKRRFVDVKTGERMILNPRGSSPAEGGRLTKVSDTYRPTDPQGPNHGIYDLCGFIHDANVVGANDPRARFTVTVIGVPSPYAPGSAGATFPPEYSLARNTTSISWTQDYITGRQTLVGASSYTNQMASTDGRPFGGKTSCNDFAPSIPGIGNPETKYRCDFQLSKGSPSPQTEIAGRILTRDANNVITEFWQNSPNACGNYSYSASLKANLTHFQGSNSLTTILRLNNCNPQPYFATGKIIAQEYELSVNPSDIPAGYTCTGWNYARYNNTSAKWETVGSGSGCKVPNRMYGVQPSPYYNSHNFNFFIRKNATTSSPAATNTGRPTVTPTRTPTPTKTQPISLSCTINDNGHAGTVIAGDKVNARVIPSVSGATTQQLTYSWTSLAFKDSITTDRSPLKIGTLSAPTAQSTVWTNAAVLPQDKNKVLLRATVTASSAGQVARATCEKVYGILGNCGEPVDVMFVIDRSSSMTRTQPNGRTKLDDAKAAASTFIDTMKTTYAGRNGAVRVGLTTFGRTLSSTQSTTVGLSSNLDDVKNRILSVAKDESGTCIECGLSVANDNLATANPKGAAQKIVIVLTDGRANRSIASNGRDIDDDAIQPALDMAQSGKEEGYAYFVVGFSSSSSPELPCTTRGYTTGCANAAGIAGYNGMPQSEVDSFYKKSSLDSSSEWAELFGRFKATICLSPSIQTVLGTSAEMQEEQVGFFGQIKNFVLHTLGY